MLPFIRTTPIIFFNDTATTEIYTLSLHDALPIFRFEKRYLFGFSNGGYFVAFVSVEGRFPVDGADRKSTRLNSSHLGNSYAVFCLKKKKYDPVVPHSTFTN